MEVTSKVLTNPALHDFWKIVDQSYLKIIHTDDVKTEDIIYPCCVTDLVFVYFSQIHFPCKEINLPETVKILMLETNYPIGLFVFPKNLEKLRIISRGFKQNFEYIEFPEKLIDLTLAGHFDKELWDFNFPSSITNLTLGDYFDKELYLDHSFENLTHLTLGSRFNQDMEHVVFPKTLTHLTLGARFNKPIDKVKFPDSLQFIRLGDQYNKDLGKINTIEIVFGYDYTEYQKLIEQRKYIKNLPKSVKNKLIEYTSPGDGAATLNSCLREGKLPIHRKKLYNGISKAFENVPPTKELITVYRGLDIEPIFTGKDFISTSLDRETSLQFAGDHCCFMEILINPGSKILPLVDISYMPEQEEILLDGRNGVFLEIKTEMRNGMKITSYVYNPKSEKETLKAIDKTLTKIHIQHTSRYCS